MKHAVHLMAGLALFGTAASGFGAEAAANDYPNRPIRFIAPFVPGGPSDILSRMLGGKLTESWGQPVVIDNRGSAGGIVGFELGAKAPPDGYSITMATGSGLVVNPHVYTKLPYAIADFAPITQITLGPNLFLIHPSVQAKTVPEFIALAKAKPGSLSFATTGTSNLISAELFKHMAGVNLLAVPYKGTGQAVTALLGNEVQLFIINLLAGGPQVKSGKLRAIGITSMKRNPQYPDVAPVADTLPGYDQITWHSIIAPARTPKPIVNKLSAELQKIIKSPDVSARIQAQGLEPVGGTPEELAELIKTDSARNAKLVKQIGLKPMSY